MYLIKISDKINKSDRIIFKKVTLDSYESFYRQIFDKLNSNNDLSISFTFSTVTSTIFKPVNTQVKGYLYNTTSTINTVLYELSLVKIDQDLSSIFTKNSETQTETETETESDTQTETESESQTESENESERVYGEFQQYQKVKTEYPCNYPFYKTPTEPIWSPELISELKMKLTLPNAGLTSNYSFNPRLI